MPVLHNRINNEELKQRLMEETEPRLTLSFYRYFPIESPHLFRDQLYVLLQQYRVFGRIYIAQEGINAQVSVPNSEYEKMLIALSGFHVAFKGIRINIAVDDDGKSFWVLRVKVRSKIVADGIDDPTFNPSDMGQHLDAAAFNQLVEDPETILVDMRNHYEYEVGHFQNAIEVPSDTFRDQLPMALEMLEEQKEKKIVMYCTGGIRCEKASAYLKHNGFKHVYQLEGGIINYAQQAKKEGLPIKFRGKNFVFDERLGERISEVVIAHCHQCGATCDTHTNCANNACHLLFIQCEQCAAEMKGCCSNACVEVVQLPDDEQEKLRKGIDRGKMIFNKSKDHPLRKHREEWALKEANNI